MIRYNSKLPKQVRLNGQDVKQMRLNGKTIYDQNHYVYDGLMAYFRGDARRNTSPDKAIWKNLGSGGNLGLQNFAYMGKNLFDPNLIGKHSSLKVIESGFEQSGIDVYPSILDYPWNSILKPNTTYTMQRIYNGVTHTQSSNGAIVMVNGIDSTQRLGVTYAGGGYNSRTFTTPPNLEDFTRIWVYGTKGEVTSYTNIQIEQGSTATPYEPYRGDTSTSGWTGNSLYFDGIDDVSDVLTLPDNVQTIEVVYTPKSNKANNTPVTNYSFANKTGFRIGNTNANGEQRFGISYNTSSSVNMSNAGRLIANTKYSISLSYDSVANVFTLYINGVFERTVAATAPAVLNNQLHLGYWAVDNPLYLSDCEVFCVRVYDRKLMEWEVLQNYNIDKAVYGV